MSWAVTDPNRRPSSPACCGIVSTVFFSSAAFSSARSAASVAARPAAPPPPRGAARGGLQAPLTLGDRSRRGRLSEPAWDEVVAQVARSDVHDVATVPERLDLLKQNGLGHRRLPVGNVRQEPQLPRPLHGLGELALVAPARPGDAGGADLALLAHGAAQRAEVLVVDDVDLVPAERARLPTPSGAGPLTAIAPARLLPAVATTLFCHLRRTPFERLEGDVVVPGSPARRCGLEVGRVGRNVALRREATAVLSA